MRKRCPIPKTFQAPDSVLVNWSCDTVSYVLLMKKDGSTLELRGVEMWFWLDEFAQHCKVFPAKAAFSKPIYKASARQLELLQPAADELEVPDGTSTSTRPLTAS